MNEISRSHSSSTKISQVESERRWSFFFHTHFQKLLLRCSADAASLELTFCQYLRDFVEQTKCIQTAGEKKSLENVDILRREKRNWSSFQFSYIFHNSIYLCIESERLHEMQFDSFLVCQKNREHSNLTTLFITTHSPIYARDRMIMRKISNFTRTAKRNNLNKTHKIYSAWMPKIDSNWNDDDDVEYCKCWGNRKNFTCTLRSRNVSHHRLRSHRQQRLRDGLKRWKIKKLTRG